MNGQNNQFPSYHNNSMASRNDRIEDAQASEALSSLNESLSLLLNEAEVKASAQPEPVPELVSPSVPVLTPPPVQNPEPEPKPEAPAAQSINPFMKVNKPVSSPQAAAGLPSLKQPVVPSPHPNTDGLPSPKSAPEIDANRDGLPSPKPAQSTGIEPPGLPSLKPPPAATSSVPELTPPNKGINFNLEPTLKSSRGIDISAQRRNTIAISPDELEKQLSVEQINSAVNPNQTPLPGVAYNNGPQMDAPSSGEPVKKRKTFDFAGNLSGSEDPGNPSSEINRATQASTPAKPLTNNMLGMPEASSPEPQGLTPVPSPIAQQQSATPMKPIAAQGPAPSQQEPIPSVPVPTLLDSGTTSDNPISGIEIQNLQPNSPVSVLSNQETPDSEAPNEELFDINSIQRKSDALKTSNDADAQFAKKRLSRLKIILLIVAVSIIILGLIGVAVAKYVYDAKNIKEEELAVIKTEENVNVNWILATNDNLSSYRLFYQQALKKLNQSDTPQAERHEIQGKILIALALAQPRYAKYFADDIEMIDNSATIIAEKCEDAWCKIGLWSWGLSQNKPEMVEKFEPLLPEDEEFQPLIKLIKACSAFLSWNPEGQTWAEHQIAGEKLLETIPEDNELSASWPLYSWIRATILQRLGKFNDAMNVFGAMAPDSEDGLNKPALLLLQNQIHLALDQYDAINGHIDSLMKSNKLSAEEHTQVERLRMIAASTLEDWKDFETKLDAFIHNKEINHAPFIGIDVCTHMNRPKACIPEIQAELALSPNDLQLRSKLIELILEAQGYDTLINPEKSIDKVALDQLTKLIDEGIAIDPQFTDFWKYKGYLEYGRNQYENANKSFDDVEHGEYLIWSGTFLRAIENWRNQPQNTQKEIRESLKNYSQSITNVFDAVILSRVLLYVGDPDTAHDVIDKVYVQHPEDTNVVNTRFDVAIAQKDRESAENIIRRLEARHGLNNEHRYKYAKLIDQLGDINTALESMLAILENDNTVPEYLFYTGLLNFIQNHFDSALFYFNQAIEIDSSDPELHFYKGRCLYEAGKYEDALIEFNEASAQNEIDMHYNLWIGLALTKMRQQADALRAFTSVIDTWTLMSKDEQTPLNTTIVAEAFFYRAELLKYQNRRSDAAKDYLKAIELAKNNIKYPSGYAVYLYENGKYKETISLVNQLQSRVADQETLDSVLFYVRGLSYLKTENRPAAVADLERARDLGFADIEELNIVGLHDPTEIYESLGYLYRDLGKREAARESLQLYIEKSKYLSPTSKREVQFELDKI